MSIMKRTSKEDAVSPVVGVMLMLVVTIVIAAVVAAFASGLGTTTEPADMALLKLTDYGLGTVDQSTTSADNLSKSYKPGWYDYGLGTYGPNSNYGIYSMKFKNMGGDKLFTDDLKLQITYNAASKSLPFKEFVNAKEWAVGDTISLEVSKEKLKTAKYNDYTSIGYGISLDTASSGWAYGLGQQSMAQESPSSFTWQILDANNNILAKGTESTKWTQNTITASYSLVGGATKLVSEGKIKITVNAPNYDDNTTISITPPADLTLDGLTDPKVTGGKYTSGDLTVTGDPNTYPITIKVGSVETTLNIKIETAA